jgi:hypothetical protein
MPVANVAQAFATLAFRLAQGRGYSKGHLRASYSQAPLRFTYGKAYRWPRCRGKSLC